MQMKQYSPSKRGTMLRQADELLAKGLSTSKIIKQLGIASPTYYAWRKQEKNGLSFKNGSDSTHITEESEFKKKDRNLLLENSRLRDLVVNMALELNQLKGF
jgi:transposase-like protein